MDVVTSKKRRIDTYGISAWHAEMPEVAHTFKNKLIFLINLRPYRQMGTSADTVL